MGTKPTPAFPSQPVVVADDGVVRFAKNRIIRDLLDKATAAKIMDLNSIQMDAANGKYTEAEQRQLAQLIGYSVDGYCDLNYVHREHRNRADKAASRVL